MTEWRIPASSLIGRRRSGGPISQRGFAFQSAYACLQLTRLLDSSQHLVAVRSEGVEDVDLLYADGREEYVQLKCQPTKRYTLASLRPILQGFAVDLLETGKSSKVTLALVARSSNVDSAVGRLRDGRPSASDVANVATLLRKSLPASPAPKPLLGLSPAERRTLAQQLLSQSKFHLGMGDELEGHLSFESHACTALAGHGVVGSQLTQALDVLRGALAGNQQFTRRDVEELLKRFTGGAAVELFGGTVEALTDELLAHPADSRRSQQYYAGAPLDWDIIAAGADVQREQQAGLVDLLSRPCELLRLVCIVAEPGAGKSTLARSVATELHRHHRAFVIRLKHKDDVNAWYRMADFYGRIRRPFYLLVDDLFRNPDVVDAVRDLGPYLPITIIATSRTNEFRPVALKGEVIPVPLRAPSPAEKDQVLRCLGKDRAALTAEQRQRLTRATQFLVVMMETTAGKQLSDIVRDSLEWLRANDEPAYRAYEYLAFAYRLGVSVPASLMDRLDAEGRFYGLALRQSAQGLIFPAEDHPGSLRVGHPVIAETAYQFYRSLRSPVAVVGELVRSVDVSDALERRFAAHLLRALARADSLTTRSALQDIEPTVAECRKAASRITEVAIWRAFYQQLGRTDEAQRCSQDCLALVPVTAGDCMLLLTLCREDGREPDAMPALARYLQTHPDAHHPRPSYLRLVERYGTEQQQRVAVRETGAWLAGHSDDTYVRTYYLALVERRGMPIQVERVLRETYAWVASHPDDTSVRIAFLALIERRGSTVQVQRALRDTEAWLASRPENSSVRTPFLGLVERHGTPGQIGEAIKDTAAWLMAHPEDTQVRTCFLGLVERHGAPGQAEQAAKDATAWLMAHPEDTHVRTCFLGLVERHGTPGRVEQAAKDTAAWLMAHPEDTHVRTCFLGFVERHGAPGQAEEAVKDATAWLMGHPEDTNVRTYFLGWVERHGTPEQQSQVLRETASWLASHPEDTNVRGCFLGSAQRIGTAGELDRAVEETSQWLVSNPRAASVWTAVVSVLAKAGNADRAMEEVTQAISLNPGDLTIVKQHLRLSQEVLTDEQVRHLYDHLTNRFSADVEIKNSYARWLIEKGRHGEAESVVSSLLASAPRSWSGRHTYGRLLLQMKRYAEAAEQFRKATELHRGFQMAHDGLAQALRGLGTKAQEEGRSGEASSYFVAAEREFRQAIYWARVNAKPQAIFYTNLGWFYVERERWRDARQAFANATQEQPEHFVNYWGVGRALLGSRHFRLAVQALTTALEKAPQGLQPPASEEIPRLLAECEAALHPSRPGSPNDESRAPGGAQGEGTRTSPQ